ncbi:hypothetical protein GDO78_023041 [Eleutherodactylus coqui]|uniref:Taste receptor type 2 n=1 Tax=Eleutherodactylus coqui TaxID=57060 RepID=A0A8J6E4Q0_ELECQ|nr:hypothetical protein GDO78_023041 [Eleutherodactylus coqui]
MDARMDSGYFFIVTTEIIFVIGLITHVFIIAVNAIAWKRRTISTSDQVTISIVIIKVTLQLLVQIKVFLESFEEIYLLIILWISEVLFLSSVFSSIWLSTLLSIVLYLKISTRHNVVFLWLKMAIMKNILSLIITIVLVSIGYCSIISVIMYFSASQNSTQEYLLNNQELHQTMEAFYYIYHILPFIICLLSSLLLIISLTFHISQIRYTQNSASSLHVYYRTIKYTTVSLLTCALYIILNIMEGELNSDFSNFLWIICTTFHSMYIIYVTTTLRKHFSRVLLQLTNPLFREKEPNSNEQAVTVTS